MRIDSQGWSLFECMVMVGLVTVVTAMLIPSLQYFREAALDARCRSNLRQLAMACTEYARNSGRFPWGSCRKDGYSTYCWDFKKRIGSAFHEPGDMWREYRADGDIVQCPKCRHMYDNWDGNAFTGYNYNCAYVGKVEGDRAYRKRPLAWGAVRFPEALLLFGDGGYAGGPNKFMRAPQATREYDYSAAGTREAGTQAFRHLGHSNVAFADGHVEAISQPYMSGGRKGWTSSKAKTGFVGADNGIYGKTALGLE